MTTSQRRSWSVKVAAATGALAVSVALPATAAATIPAPTPYIVGGNPATSTAYPWMVDIEYRQHPVTGEVGFHTCGGVLISADKVETAAHCFSGIDHDGNFVKADPSEFQIRVGSLNRHVGGEVRDIRSIAFNPQWNFKEGGEDIAVLHLDEPVHDIMPVQTAPVHAPASAPRRILGWGVTDPIDPAPGDSSHNPDLLQEQDVTLVADSTCQKAFDGPLSIKPAVENCMVDKGKPSSSACFGDSGGPEIAFTGGRWKLEGLISRGNGVENCQSSPAILTDATAYTVWAEVN